MGTAKKKLEKKSAVAKKKADSPTIYNRKARQEFELLDTLQAGIILTGTEIRSIRLGRGQLGEGFVRIDKAGEVYLYGMTIPQYEFGNRYNHDPTRIRKLLLNRKEINRWHARVDREKLTIVPLRLFFRSSWAKLEIALAKRKLAPDKRKDLKDKAIERDMKREIKDKVR
jgi:SsrA-binding protein